MCDYEAYLDDVKYPFEDNPVHTLLYLSGTADALSQSAEIVRRLNKTGIEPKGQIYGIMPDEIREGIDGDNRWFEIIFDNHVPQIYEDLQSVEGLNPVIFVVYSSLDTFMNTNDVDGVMWKRRDIFGIPEDLDVELIDDYPDTFAHASTYYK